MKKPIPMTPLMGLYREMRYRMSQPKRLQAAQELCADADEFASKISESIQRFNSYDNTVEPFCPKHERLTPPGRITDGRLFAAALAAGRQTVRGSRGFTFELVDYEVPPARTTVRAPFMLNRFEDGTRSTTAMKIDLLLRHDDGTPIVGEAKVVTEVGYDTDSVLALVQALAGATQFATPNQFARLEAHYDKAFNSPEVVDVAVATYLPPTPPAASLQPSLDEAARKLAGRLAESKLFPAEIRNIWFVTARGSPDNLDLSM